jgi:ankyrin repeat protein
VKYLCHRQCDVNIKSNNDFTPIFVSILEEHVEIAKCLVEHKADVNISDQNDYTPIFAAVQNGSLECKCYQI